MFPSDIARWALGGRDPEEENNTNSAEAPASSAPLTEEDMRARRMARLAALEKQGSSTTDSMDVDHKKESDAMEVDSPPAAAAKPESTSAKSNISNTASSNAPSTLSEPATKKQATKLSPAEKLLRRKNQILRKVLLLSLSDDTGSGVILNLEPNPSSPLKGDWDQSHIAEILATRLSYEKIDPRLDMARGGGGNDLVGYLNGCYRRSWGEWKDLKDRKKSVDGAEELEAILVEMRSQVSLCDVLIFRCVFYLL
jgi:hypothetical protein